MVETFEAASHPPRNTLAEKPKSDERLVQGGVMKRCHANLVVAAVLVGAIAAPNAYAGGHGGGHWGGRGGGAHFIAPFDPRVMLGAALLAPLLYSPPPPAYYYPPASVVVPAPAYVQPYPGQAMQQAPGYWHYCASAKLYHPYVQVCPEGWQQIPRQPLF
jgi:hypothetical protein